MIDGTWFWYEWVALFVLFASLAISAATTHKLMNEKGYPVLAALCLAAWIYAGCISLMTLMK